MQDKITEINPINMINDFANRFPGFNAIERQHKDAGFEWIGENDKCVTIKNPKSDTDIAVLMEDQGEFTLFFSSHHCHYPPDDEGYFELIDTAEKILNGELCAASIHYGEEEKWFGSMLCSRSEINNPVTEVFDFVFRQKEFNDRIKKAGGAAYFTFWDPAESRSVPIARG